MIKQKSVLPRAVLNLRLKTIKNVVHLCKNKLVSFASLYNNSYISNFAALVESENILRINFKNNLI